MKDLGRHVGQRAGDDPGFCQRLGRSRDVVRGNGSPRQAEVEHFYPILGTEHDVRALEVAVDDTTAVRVNERRRDLHADCDHVVRRKRPRGHPIRQRLTLDVLHHDVRVRPRLSNLVDRADTWMVQRGGGACLAEQLAGAALIAGRADELQCYGSIEARVAGEIDNPHSAAANLPDDVVVADRAADHCLANHTDWRPAARRRHGARVLMRQTAAGAARLLFTMR
jgi:hypothetical protein